MVMQRIIIFALSAGPMPRHVAFVMDGNRRYARQRNEPATKGHDYGSQALKEVLYSRYSTCIIYLITFPRF